MTETQKEELLKKTKVSGTGGPNDLEELMTGNGDH